MTQDTLKTLKAGQQFTVLTFTGLNIGQFTVTAVSKSQFKAVKQDGSEMVFDRATGKQTNAATEKYANKAVDLMPIPVFDRTPKKPRKAKPVIVVEKTEEVAEKEVSKVAAEALPEVAEEDDEFEEFEEIE